MNTPSTQINIRCDLGNPKWEKTQWECDDYALLSFSLVKKCKYKERGNHYGVALGIMA